MRPPQEKEMKENKKRIGRELRFSVCQADVGVKAGCLGNCFHFWRNESWLEEDGPLWERRAKYKRTLAAQRMEFG